MASKRISQREAIRNRRELKALRTFVNDAMSTMPGHYLMDYSMDEFPFKNDMLGTVRTANRMEATVVARVEFEGQAMKMRLRYIKRPEP